MQTVEQKIDAAVHAAIYAMGLSVEGVPDLADVINDHLAQVASPYLTDDDDDDEGDEGQDRESYSDDQDRESYSTDGLDEEDAIGFTASMAALKLPEEDPEYLAHRDNPENGGSIDDYIADLPNDRLFEEYAVFCDMIRAARAIVARESI